MGVPGSNLLAQALTVIRSQTVNLLKYSSRTKNSVGLLVTVYQPPVEISGSLQAVPRNLYQANGLDFQKNYVTFYATKALLDVTRDISGDQIVYSNVVYQCESKNNWFAQDGWVGMLCVEVGTYSPTTAFSDGFSRVSFG